jgi:hypothetical protein
MAPDKNWLLPSAILFLALVTVLALTWRTEVSDERRAKRCVSTLYYLDGQLGRYRLREGAYPPNLSQCVPDPIRLKCPTTRLLYGYLTSPDRSAYCLFDSAPHDNGTYVITNDSRVMTFDEAQLYQLTNAIGAP